MISMMQSLIHNDRFLELFYKKLQNRTIEGIDREILSRLDDFIIAYKHGADEQQVELLINELKEALHYRNPGTFTEGVNAQQDATAVVQVLFEVLKLTFKTSQSIKPEGQPSVCKLETLGYLNLHIEGNSMKSCLDAYFGEDAIEYNRAAATKQRRLATLPDILSVSLNRYDPEMNKISTAIANDGIIDLSPYLQEGVDEPALYEVEAVVRHIGGLSGGHYVADVKKGGQWYHCNDSSVKPIQKPDLANGYSFIFRRIESGAPVVPPIGIKREGNLCYLNAFYQALFATDDSLGELKNQHSTLTNDQFLEVVKQQREAIFGQGDAAMKDLQDELPRLLNFYQVPFLRTAHKEIPVVAIPTVPKGSNLAAEVEKKLRHRQIQEFPQVLPVAISYDNAISRADPNELIHLGEHKYRLKSAIILKDRHYTTLVFKENHWFECNDEKVVEVDEERLAAATTFFYEKI